MCIVGCSFARDLQSDYGKWMEIFNLYTRKYLAVVSNTSMVTTNSQ